MRRGALYPQIIHKCSCTLSELQCAVKLCSFIGRLTERDSSGHNTNILYICIQRSPGWRFCKVVVNFVVVPSSDLVLCFGCSISLLMLLRIAHCSCKRLLSSLLHNVGWQIYFTDTKERRNREKDQLGVKRWRKKKLTPMS